MSDNVIRIDGPGPEVLGRTVADVRWRTMVAKLESGDPQRLGPYWLICRLGSGGFGTVFLGRSEDGALAAVKVISAPMAGDARARSVLAREAAAVREVRSRYVAPVIDAELDGPIPWLATLYVSGPSLARAVNRGGPLPAADVLSMAAGLAEALCAVHAAGLVHRDVKPSNVMLASDGPRLVDFGLSRFADTLDETNAGAIIGTPAFMSPEQVTGGQVGPPSDIFSLGAVLAYAATGDEPFGEGSVPEVLRRVADGDLRIGRLTADVASLVVPCMARDPRSRPTAAALLAKLVSARPGLDWLPPTTAAGEESPVAPEPVACPAVPQPAAPPAPAPPVPFEPEPFESVLLGPAEARLVTGAVMPPTPVPASGRDWQGTAGPPAADSDNRPEPRRRYLKGQCPESVQVHEPFSLLASIVLAASAGARLRTFGVGLEGQDVLLVAHAPGLRLLGRGRVTVHVPRDGDSDPVMFELRADAPGPWQVSITAWVDGTYLGELVIETTAERCDRSGPHRDTVAEIGSEPADGAVSLVVRYDPGQNAYRFEFRDRDNPEEVTTHLAYDPGPLVEQLVFGLDQLAKGRTGYSPDQTRDYLINAGAELWRGLVPSRLREQFWERQHRIQQLTILADGDAVPWELLYPLDPGHDAGFLVEQFPVTRAAFGRLPARYLSLQPARFVLPQGSPSEARDEIDALKRVLHLDLVPPGEVISALTPLLDLIRSGNFGLLHFACHNVFSSAAGSSITLDKRQFTPTLLTTAAISQVLTSSAPIVFINACRSAGTNATYNRLDGWASKFLQAGAGAFIGSLWAVRDSTACDFASELYRQLQAGSPLGKAAMQARRAAAREPGDPTWLAYTVYGDSQATIR